MPGIYVHACWLLLARLRLRLLRLLRSLRLLCLLQGRPLRLLRLDPALLQDIDDFLHCGTILKVKHYRF